MGSTFSIGGISSGYDTTALIDAMVAAQSASIKPMQVQVAQLNKKLTAVQSLEAAVIALQTQTQTLTSASTFSAASATSSAPDSLAVTASSSAVAGSYTIQVQSVATAAQSISQGFDDTTTTTVGTGTITLGLGNASYAPITIDSSNNTLTGIASAINNAGLPVTASIVNDGGSSASYHLVLTSSVPGAANTISFSSSLSGGTAPTFSTLQAAKDAEVRIGDVATGLTIKAASNQITNLIPGVTVNLLGQTSSSVTVQVKSDTSAIRSNINAFINAYNSTVDLISANTAYDATSKTGAPLMGDPSTDILSQQLVTMTTYARSTSSTSDLKSLSDIGITLDGGGHLTVSDSSALTEALSTKLSAVKSLFSDSSTGIANRLNTFLKSSTMVGTGFLEAAQTAIKNQTETVSDSIAEMKAQMVEYRSQLELQFADMEGTLTLLQSQSQFFSANIAASLASAMGTSGGGSKSK